MIRDNKNHVLLDRTDELLDSDKPTVIEVDNVSLDYNFANQKLGSLKEYFITLAKRQLMFKSFRALDGVSLAVQSGDVYGILGTNGSGKSTLLKIVSGVLDPTEGTVKINGNIAPLIEMGAGFDFELTARENIFLNGSLLGYSRSFIESHFDDIVSFAEIEDFLDLPLKNYSSGMVSRIAFAIATVIVPDILVVDEVLSVGDQMFQRKCEKRIQELIKDHNTTVLIVSHSSDLIDRICNKAIWIEKGKMRMVGHAKEVSRAYQVLGGHSGSEDSEQLMFEIMQTESESTAPGITSLIDDTFGLVSSASNKRVLSLDGEVDSVVVIQSDNISRLLLALSLASRHNAIMLKAGSDGLDSDSALMLQTLSPKQIFVVQDSSASPVLDDLPNLCSESDIIYYNQNGLSDLAKAINEDTEPNSHHSETAAFVIDKVPKMTAGFCSYIYENELPVYVSCLANDMYKNAFQEILEKGYKHIICLHNDRADMDELRKNCANQDILIDSFNEDQGMDAIEKMIGWQVSQDDTYNCAYILSVDDFVLAAFTAPLAAREHALTIPVIREDMDSISSALRYVLSDSQDIENIRLVGTRGSFDNAEIELYSKALSLEKRTVSLNS